MENIIHGVRVVSKAYHEVMAIVLEETGQTQAEAAEDLGISVSYFNQLYRLKKVPNFRTNRGKELEERIRDWSGIAAGLMFPEGFFTKEFLEASKTHTTTIPFHKYLRMTKTILELPEIAKTQPIATATASPKKKRRAKRKKK